MALLELVGGEKAKERAGCVAEGEHGRKIEVTHDPFQDFIGETQERTIGGVVIYSCYHGVHCR